MRFVFVVIALFATGCFAPRYLAQAGYGQLELMTSSRPIDEVIADPDTDDHTRAMLLEVAGIKAYGREVGLSLEGNYGRYIELDRSASVYFVAASRPLAFEPKVWCWPIVGCFPMLGWFDLEEAIAFRKSLMNDGWEVYLRGAGAFSTAGWFRDPIVSSMIAPGENAYGDLVNVVLHELMHVTVLIEDQAYFNESVAAYTADGMADAYLVRRFGEGSPEVVAYREDLARQKVYGERLWQVYKELDALYQSSATDTEKRARKKAIIDEVERELRLVRRPNNASLIGFKTYRSGFADFEKLRAACPSWPRFLAALKRVRKQDFQKPLQEDFAQVLDPLIKRGC